MPPTSNLQSPTSRAVVLDARTANDHFPGIGRYVVNLAHALTRIAPERDFVSLYDPSATDVRWRLPESSIACPVSPFSLRQQWVVPPILRRAHAELYHSTYYLMPYRPGVPTLLTCYDLLPLVYPQYFTVFQRLVYRAAHLLARRTARVIFAVSEATKNDLLIFFRFDPAKIVVTVLAAEARFTPQPAEAISDVRRAYGLPEQYVLYCGSNKPHKNLARLVAACAQVRAPLVIAGHWDARYPAAKQIAERLSAPVVFAHAVPDTALPALYSGAAAFVFPSEYEGFGLPVIEAMACGAPVVCSNAASLPEVVGAAARLIDPHSVDEMAAAIQRVLSDAALREELRAKSLARAAHFSWERTARETLAVYERVTRKQGNR